MDLLKKIKVELWVFFLVGIISFIGLMGFGALVVHKVLAPSNKFPVMSGIAYFIAEIPTNLRDIIQGKGGSKELKVKDRFPELSGFHGEPIEEEVYLLLSKYNGDSERSTVELIDLRSFEVKKTWLPEIDEINKLVDISDPQFVFTMRDKYERRYSVRHPFLTEDGGLIFQDDSPLVKIDKNSQLVWQNQEDLFHHSAEQDYEGSLWVPSHVYPYIVDKKYFGLDHEWALHYKDDAITKVSLDGEILFQKSITQLFIENNLHYMLFPVKDVISRDHLHINDIQPVLTDGPHWKRGDVFISLRGLSMIMLYRPSTNKIIWKMSGLTSAQHDVDILDDHRISIFNNNAYRAYRGSKVDGNNQIVIYDFNTKSSSKYFEESLIKYDVRTINQGLHEILNGGDLIIEEQNYGRLLYFNKDSSLQWQYVNRAYNGNIYTLNWSRILHKLEDIQKVRKIIKMGAQ